MAMLISIVAAILLYGVISWFSLNYAERWGEPFMNNLGSPISAARVLYPPPLSPPDYSTASASLHRPVCYLDQQTLAGYDEEETKQFFRRDSELTICSLKYPGSLSKIKADTLEVKEREPYLYSLLDTPGYGQNLTTSQHIPWKPAEAGSSIPVGDSEIILHMSGRMSGYQTRLHLRTAYRELVAEVQAQRRRQWVRDRQLELLDSGVNNQQRPLLFSGDTPAIIHLDLDSTSRAHFRRMLRRTMALLDSVESKDDSTHQFYDFHLHNVIGDSTEANMVPFLHGWRTLENITTGIQPLFEAMKEAGFVTAYIQDDCHSSLAPKHGRNPAHHCPNQAWCIAKKLWGYSDLSNNTRCLGDRPSNAHALSYISSFLETYSDNARYVMAHLGDGHEVTGTVIKSVDEALQQFIESFLQHNSPETVLIISSDHGMRYGGWRRSLHGFLEHKLPPLFLLVPRAMTSKAASAFWTLKANTRLLNTKLDLHTTLKHMQQWPLPLSAPLAEQSFGRSLLTEIPINRTCSDSGIPEEYCACSPWHDHDLRPVGTTGSVGKPTPKRLAQLFVKTINDAVPRFSMAVSGSKYSYCGVVQLHNISKFSSQEIQPHHFEDWRMWQPLHRNFKVHFTTTLEGGLEDDEPTDWEGVMNLRAFGAKDLVVDVQQGFQPMPGDFDTEIYTVRSIGRPSDWPTACRNQAFADGLDPKYCVCSVGANKYVAGEEKLKGIMN